MKLTKDKLKQIVGAIANTQDKEMGCGDCFQKMHEFARMELQGKPAEKAMPLVKEHLDHCGDCREEYEALIEALKNVGGA